MLAEWLSRVAHLHSNAAPAITAQRPSRGGRNRIAIDLVRNFLEIANEDHCSALADLFKIREADSSSPVVNSRSSPQVIVSS
jgi:hypothetical protein